MEGEIKRIMNNLVKPTNLRYCSYCGAEMIERLDGAETCYMFYGDMPTIPVGSRFNRKTGKQQFCYRYICPHWKKKIFFRSPHDNYFLEEIINL